MGVVSESFGGCPFSCCCAGGIGRGILKSWRWNCGDGAGSELAVMILCWLCGRDVALRAGWVEALTVGAVGLGECSEQGCESKPVCSYGAVVLFVIEGGVCHGGGTSQISVDADGLSFC